MRPLVINRRIGVFTFKSPVLCFSKSSSSLMIIKKYRILDFSLSRDILC